MRDFYVSLLQASNLPAWLVPNLVFLTGFTLAAGFGIALFLWKRDGHRPGVAACLLSLASPLIFAGAKLLYLVQRNFADNLEILPHPGYSLYGSLFLVLLFWVTVRVFRPFPLMFLLDCATPAAALGLCFMRIGCFLAGCCPGTTCTLPWAMHFPRQTLVFAAQLKAGLVPRWANESLPVHPTQLYEAMFGLICFALLMVLMRKRSWNGQVFFTGMLWYGFFRIAIAPLRVEEAGFRFPGGLTMMQLISVVLIVAGLAAFYRMRKCQGIVETSCMPRFPRPNPASDKA